MSRIIVSLFITAFCLVLFSSCVSVQPEQTVYAGEPRDTMAAISSSLRMGNPHPAAERSYELSDILPEEFVFENVDQSGLNRTDLVYSDRFRRALDYMKAENYAGAAELYEWIVNLYNDEGIAFYNLSICYYNEGNYSKALECAAASLSCGYKVGSDYIDNIIFSIGYSFLEKKDYRKAIAAFKNCLLSDVLNQNILFSYTELASTLSAPESIILLFYAGHYVERNRVSNNNVGAMASMLASLVIKHEYSLYAREAADLVEKILEYNEGPHLHQSAGLLSLHANDLVKAEAHFAVIEKNYRSQKELHVYARQKLIEIRGASYAYTKVCPFTVSGSNLKEGDIEFIYSVPQNTASQSVKNLTITLNGRPVNHETVTDVYGAAFARLVFTGQLKTGKNVVEIKAHVRRDSRRFDAAEAAENTVLDYNTADEWYRFLTKGNPVYRISDSAIKSTISAIRKKVPSGNLAETVRAVYDHVIDTFTYELYDNSRRAKKDIIALMKRKNYRGLCEDYAAMTVTLLRGLGIPSLVMTGPTFESEIGHAWPVFFLPGSGEAINIDATWGDDEWSRAYYFLFNSSLTVIEGVGWDSDLMPDGQSTWVSSSSGIRITLGEEKTVIVLKGK